MKYTIIKRGPDKFYVHFSLYVNGALASQSITLKNDEFEDFCNKLNIENMKG